jgi:hypothetical protein
MDDKELLNFIDSEELAVNDSDLQSDRERALDYYYGRAVGKLATPTIPNRSGYVSRDVSDTIDWIKPALMKTFMSGDSVCEFTPKGPEDVEAAEQETDYVNHVILSQNNAYEIFEAWFDDALIQKNGYVVAHWKKDQSIKKEVYENQDEASMFLLMQDPCLQIESVETLENEYGVTYNAVFQRVNDKSKICIENIPPELVRVSQHHRKTSLDDCAFIGYDSYQSISSLREDGYEVDDDISDNYGDADQDVEIRQRYYSYNRQENASTEDPSNRIVCVRNRWVKVDYDGDGIAELRFVKLVGETFLENTETDMIPMSVITPRLVAHNHIGRSVEEVVEDLMELKTTFMRGLIDNTTLANNTRTAVDANVVNLDDLMVARPGGVVRVKGSPGAAIMPLNHQMLGAPVMGAVEMIDSIRETRTGVTKYSQGTDAGRLNGTATGISIITNNANQRIEWIARTFAETGVKRLFYIVHALLLKHQDKQAVIKLRGKWVTVNPREWTERNDMVVSVGLGATNQQIQLQSLMALGNVQREAAAVGLVQPQNVFELVTEVCKAMGFKQPEKFFTNPANMPKKEPQPDPRMEKIKADMVNAEKDRELEREKLDHEKKMDGVDLLKDMFKQISPEQELTQYVAPQSF